MCGAGESPVVAIVTGGVLQAEAGLVALSHRLVGAGLQQLVVAELIHAVEVPVDQQQLYYTTFLIQVESVPRQSGSYYALSIMLSLTRGCFCY